MNEKDLVTFEQAKKLKELGFSYPTAYYYDKYGSVNQKDVDPDYIPDIYVRYSYIINNKYNTGKYNACDAPFLYQVQNWLREEKNIHITIDTYYPNWVSNDWTLTYECIIIYLDKHLRDCLTYRPSTYEEALSYGINKVLESL